MNSKNFFLKSNYDETIFEVNQMVVNSSVLLKNLFEISAITSDPIGIDCSASSLKIFIEIIQIKDENAEDAEKINDLEAELFKDFSDTDFANFINETCILDSDILLNVLADKILKNLQDMTVAEINEYLQIDNDFTFDEREWQKNNMLEYFISLNDPSFPLQFPLLCQSFYSLKTRFSSPLNILLARICQRSDPQIAYKLGQCCKALKNECDREPIKVSSMVVQYLRWHLTIKNNNIPLKWAISINPEKENHFFAISKRRVMVWNDDIRIIYSERRLFEFKTEVSKKYSSLDWVVPHKNVKSIEVIFAESEIFITNFNVKKFPFFHVSFDLGFNQGIDFDFVYDNLIEKDLSKEVKLFCSRLNFHRDTPFRMHKKSNATRFFRCCCATIPKKENLDPRFKALLLKHMEYDGHFEFSGNPPVIPEHISKCLNIRLSLKYCLISDFLEHL